MYTGQNSFLCDLCQTVLAIKSSEQLYFHTPEMSKCNVVEKFFLDNTFLLILLSFLFV